MLVTEYNISCLELPKRFYDDVAKWLDKGSAVSGLNQSAASGTPGADPQDCAGSNINMRQLLGWLWETLVEPVCEDYDLVHTGWRAIPKPNPAKSHL